jgi:hypothetical protein
LPGRKPFVQSEAKTRFVLLGLVGATLVLGTPARARLSLVRAIWQRADSGDELRIRQLRAVYGDRIWHWRFMRAEHYVSAAGAEGAQEKLLKY